MSIHDRAFWPLLFATYFAAQMVMRLLIGPALELDEAEAFYYARHLALGYGAQPPLYFWLQWALFQIFGEGLFALALLKALLLTTALTILYYLLLTALPVRAAGIAAASLSLLPQIVWEAQRALTHSVLVLTMAVILFAVAWLVIEKRRWRYYLLLGVVMGLGLLSKYNFALLPVGLLAAALAVPAWRARLRPWPLLASTALALIIVAPVAMWSLQNADVATGSLHKLGLATMGPVMARLTGAGALVTGLLAFLAMPVVILVPFALVRDPALRPDMPAAVRLLAIGATAALAALALALLAAGGTEIKDRWLLPLAWPLVPVAVAILWPLLGPTPQRVLGGVILGLWLLAMALLPYASLRDPGYRNADFGALMAEVQGLSPGTMTVGSDTVWVMGNLAYGFPEVTLVRPDAFPPEAFVLVTAADGDAVSDARAGQTVGYELQHGNRAMDLILTRMDAD